MPDEAGRGPKFQSILEDELRMPALFEDFLRNFYKTELTGYSVKRDRFSWLAEAEEEADLAYLPDMETDISLRSGNRIIVADAKYYREMMSGGRYSAKVRSDHLYQLSAYLAHVQAREPEAEVSGMTASRSRG
jgi:5-methylcytosine-specific restriction enzyme subunit McrC